MIDIGAIINSADKRPDLPEHDLRVRCVDHPRAEVRDGFGLAGGGFGVYTYCGQCGRVLTKTAAEE